MATTRNRPCRRRRVHAVRHGVGERVGPRRMRVHRARHRDCSREITCARITGRRTGVDKRRHRLERDAGGPVQRERRRRRVVDGQRAGPGSAVEVPVARIAVVDRECRARRRQRGRVECRREPAVGLDRRVQRDTVQRNVYGPRRHEDAERHLSGQDGGGCDVGDRWRSEFTERRGRPRDRDFDFPGGQRVVRVPGERQIKLCRRARVREECRRGVTSRLMRSSPWMPVAVPVAPGYG